MPEFLRYNTCREVFVCVNSRMCSKSVMHISPLVRMRLRMRSLEASEQARKIWAPKSRLKCFNRIPEGCKIAKTAGADPNFGLGLNDPNIYLWQVIN